MRVMILTGGYLPGYRYGGPVRSLEAIVEHLGDEIDFSIVTSNHDLGDSAPYPNVRPNAWMQVGNAEVWYTANKRLSLEFWRKMLADRTPDVIYLNSFFSLTTIALLIWFKTGRLPERPIVLAPRGEFSKGALNLKSNKKRIFMTLARRLGIYRKVAWHVSSLAEAEDLRCAIPEAQLIHIAPNLLSTHSDRLGTLRKLPGEVKLVHIARVSPKKNLLGAIQYLQSQSGKAIFDVYGPIEDEAYWRRCLEASSQLPANIEFSYRGELVHSEVAETLERYHFMLLPTLGENFGHSIAEALSQGLPVLISDQTPWRNLEDLGVGWDIDLNRMEEWSRVIDQCISMDDSEYRVMREKCRHYVDHWVEEHGGCEANLEMFHSVAASKSNE